VSKIQASVRLDLNLEKGRIRDESSVHELKIKETDNRIEYLHFSWEETLMCRQEIGIMRAQLETTKFQIIQWLFGVVTGAGALGLGSIICKDYTDSQHIFDYLVKQCGVGLVGLCYDCQCRLCHAVSYHDSKQEIY